MTISCFLYFLSLQISMIVLVHAALGAPLLAIASHGLPPDTFIWPVWITITVSWFIIYVSFIPDGYISEEGEGALEQVLRLTK